MDTRVLSRAVRAPPTTRPARALSDCDTRQQEGVYGHVQDGSATFVGERCLRGARVFWLGCPLTAFIPRSWHFRVNVDRALLEKPLAHVEGKVRIDHHHAHVRGRERIEPRVNVRIILKGLEPRHTGVGDPAQLRGCRLHDLRARAAERVAYASSANGNSTESDGASAERGCNKPTSRYRLSTPGCPAQTLTSEPLNSLWT